MNCHSSPSRFEFCCFAHEDPFKALAFVGRNKDAMAIIHTVDHMVGSKDPKESHEVSCTLRCSVFAASTHAHTNHTHARTHNPSSRW